MNVEHRSGIAESKVLEELAKKEWSDAMAAERLAVRVLARREAEDVLARREAAEVRAGSALYRPVNTLALAGWVLILTGLCGMGYFFLVFSVGAPGAEVVNLGLLNERLVGVIISGFCFVAGVVMVAARPRGEVIKKASLCN